MWLSDKWEDFEILDTSEGEKLERWGKYILIRPDPQVIWKVPKNKKLWESAHGHYIRSKKGGGYWKDTALPDIWTVKYRDLLFRLKPMGFKHTGLFPEQAVNWDFMRSVIKFSGRKVNVLNLFGYTGGATVALAKEGASVCHVDASKGMTAWAKENAKINGLENAPIRYIVDDCVKFVEREIRRGKKYDAIVMDPPSYGRGPSGEIWKLEDNIHELVKLCSKVLSDDPLFFLINSYTQGLSPSVMTYLLNITIADDFGGIVSCDEIGLPVTNSVCTDLVLPCGCTSRWYKNI